MGEMLELVTRKYPLRVGTNKCIECDLGLKMTIDCRASMG